MILNLILYCKENNYNKMRDVLRKYLKKTNVKYFFYCYDENISSDYEIKDDMLLIKGTETYVPGILQKTLKAIEIVLKLELEFEYIVRSNISTVVDMGKLKSYLKNNKVYYGGSSIYNLMWLDPAGGINDNRYWNTKYAHGTGIIISREMAELMISKKNNINYDVIDDLSIGLFLKKQNILPKAIDNYVFLINSPYSDNRTIFYRNKSPNRLDDVKNMVSVTDQLIYQQDRGISTNKCYAYYGTEKIYYDVLQIIMDKFVKDNKLIIPVGTVMNNIFGDPCYGFRKKLRLGLHGDKTEMMIDEITTEDLIVNDVRMNI